MNLTKQCYLICELIVRVIVSFMVTTILVSSKWAGVYSIAHFSRDSPLKLDLFQSVIIFTLLYDLSPAPKPICFDVTLQATNPST